MHAIKSIVMIVPSMEFPKQDLATLTILLAKMFMVDVIILFFN